MNVYLYFANQLPGCNSPKESEIAVADYEEQNRHEIMDGDDEQQQ